MRPLKGPGLAKGFARRTIRRLNAGGDNQDSDTSSSPALVPFRPVTLIGFAIVLWIGWLQFSTRLLTVPVGMNYWSDPTVAYLFNSLNLAEGHLPMHSDHPGTPVQLAGAALLRLIGFVRGADSLAVDVVSNSIIYEAVLNHALAAAFLLLQLGMLHLIHRRREPWPALLLLSWPLMTGDVWPFVGVHSEAGLLVANQLLLGLLLWFRHHPARLADWLIPLVFAIGITSKFVFLAWGPFLLIASNNRRLRLRNAVIFTGVLLLPAIHQIPSTLGLYADVIFSGGHYGRIGHSDAAWRDMAANIPIMLRDIPLQLGMLVILGAVAFYRPESNKPIDWRQFLTAPTNVLLFSILFAIVVTLRQWHGKHLLCIAAMLMTAGWLQASEMRFKRMPLTGFALLALLAIITGSISLNAFAMTFAQQRSANEVLLQTIDDRYPESIKLIGNDHFLPAPHPKTIAEFGDLYSSPYRGHSVGRAVTRYRLGTLIHELYPEAYSFDRHSNYVFTASGHVSMEEFMSATGRRPIILGLPPDMPFPSIEGYRFEPRECSLNFGWFRLHPMPPGSTEIPPNFLRVTSTSRQDVRPLFDGNLSTSWSIDGGEPLQLVIQLPSTTKLTGITFIPPASFSPATLPTGCRVSLKNTLEETRVDQLKQPWHWYRSVNRFTPLTNAFADVIEIELHPGWGGAMTLNEVIVHAIPPAAKKAAER